MRHIISIALFLFLSFSFSQEINWVSLEKAQKLQKQQPKKIMMDVYTKWCGPCKLLDLKTFHDKSVVEYVNKHFYAVKFNAEGNNTFSYKDIPFSNPKYDPKKAESRNSRHTFASYLNITAYPTVVFFDEKADVITPLVGYFTPSQLELYLKLFSGEKYKNITTKEQFKNYKENFVSEF